MDGGVKSQHVSRLSVLLDRLESRTYPTGDARPGYTQNVAMLRAEIKQLQDAQERASGK